MIKITISKSPLGCVAILANTYEVEGPGARCRARFVYMTLLMDILETDEGQFKAVLD
jgi:hypothetical protein